MRMVYQKSYTKNELDKLLMIQKIKTFWALNAEKNRQLIFRRFFMGASSAEKKALGSVVREAKQRPTSLVKIRSDMYDYMNYNFLKLRAKGRG